MVAESPDAPEKVKETPQVVDGTIKSRQAVIRSDVSNTAHQEPS